MILTSILIIESFYLYIFVTVYSLIVSYSPPILTWIHNGYQENAFPFDLFSYLTKCEIVDWLFIPIHR